MSSETIAMDFGTGKAQKMMDESPCIKMSAIISGSIAAAGFAVATTYLGIYAYSNPDPDSCWVVKDLELPALTKNDVITNANNLNVEVTKGYPVNMHKLNLAWFTWGFYANVAIVAAFVVAGIVNNWCKASALKISGISFLAYMFNLGAWVTTGAIWRFSKAGETASGNRLERPAGITDDAWDASVEASVATYGYQRKSALFMKIYVLLLAIVLAMAIVGGIAAGFVHMCCGKAKEEGEESALLDNEKGKSSTKKESGDKEKDRKDRKQRDKSSTSQTRNKQQ